jgi:predicted dehydrogenase
LITGKRDDPFLGVILTYDAGGERPQPADTVFPFRNPEPEGPVTDQGKHQPSAVTLGVLGAGNFATAVMLPALKKVPGIELVGMVSGSGLSAAHAARKFGFRYAADSVERILADPEINTVAILTRHNLHAVQAVAALSAGKHVFVEKPLALTREQLSEIRTQLQKRGDCLLMTGFNRRFAPLAQVMQTSLVDRQEPLVAHYRVNAGFIPAGHWLHDSAIGGGRIIGEACHFIDFLTYLVGQIPLTVTAHGIPDHGIYSEDNVVLTLTYPDGSVGTVSYLANGDKAFPKERVEVFTGGRVAVLDDFRKLEMIRDGRRRVVRSPFRQDKGHRAEWQAFVVAILNAGDPPIPYPQLWGVMQATYAAVEALRSGERVSIAPDSIS